MKTLKIYSALIFTMIFICVNAGYAKKINDNYNQNTNPTIQVMYKVVVHLDTEKSFCNVYQIEIIDATGKQVAPAQIYDKGTPAYKFFESTRETKGIRIARLVEVPYGPHAICPNNLYGAPDAKVIEFHDGSTYQFDLYPKIGTIRNISE